MRSRKWMEISGYGKLTEIVVRGPDQGAPGVSANVRWTLCWNPERLRQRQAHVWSYSYAPGIPGKGNYIERSMQFRSSRQLHKRSQTTLAWNVTCKENLCKHMPGWKQAQTDVEIGTIWTVSPSTGGWRLFFGYAYHSRTHSYYAKSIWIRNRHDYPIETNCLWCITVPNTRNYISPILNTVCTFSFDNEATQRDHHNELEKLCTVIHA